MRAMRLQMKGRYWQTDDGTGYILFTIIITVKFGFLITLNLYYTAVSKQEDCLVKYYELRCVYSINLLD